MVLVSSSTLRGVGDVTPIAVYVGDDRACDHGLFTGIGRQDVRASGPWIAALRCQRGLNIEHARYLARHIPGAKYVELPRADHFFFTGNPRRFN